ncbi:MAG: hypothetical protein R3E79_05955 [Caldilineaceae bacterium]
MNDQDKNLQAYLNDMYGVEKHTLEAVKRQLDHKDVQNKPQAHQLIQRIQSTLEQHTMLLDQRLDKFGGRSAVKSAVSSVTGAVAGAYDQVRTETVSSMLRDDYTALSMVAIANTMLHTTALSLHDQVTANMAMQHLKDVTPLITEISKVIPVITVQDVHDDVESADTSVAQQAVRNTQQAWEPDHVNQMSTNKAYAMAD